MSSGKAAIAPFTVTKAIDSSSPQFFLYTCNGKHIPSVVLELVSAGETAQPFLRYTLSDVIVSSVQTSGAGGGGGAEHPTEQVSFVFAKINIEYMSQNAKTGAVGAKSTAEWDLKMMKGASSGGAAPDGSAGAAATDTGAGGAGAAAPAAGGAAPAAAGAASADPGAAAATPSGGAGGAAPAAGDAAAAQAAGAAKPLSRAQRDRMKVQPGQPAPAQPK
jgi:type VI secretion system secreted protein Hcp